MQTWILFALLTVASWGIYGVLLHAGQVAMGDPQNGRYKAFFWVGIAYFLIAVLAPAGMLLAAKASWSMPGKAVWLSLLAGAVGVASLGSLLRRAPLVRRPRAVRVKPAQGPDAAQKETVGNARHAPHRVRGIARSKVEGKQRAELPGRAQHDARRQGLHRLRLALGFEKPRRLRVDEP